MAAFEALGGTNTCIELQTNKEHLTTNNEPAYHAFIPNGIRPSVDLNGHLVERPSYAQHSKAILCEGASVTRVCLGDIVMGNETIAKICASNDYATMNPWDNAQTMNRELSDDGFCCRCAWDLWKDETMKKKKY